MARWVKFFTVRGLEITYSADAEVRTPDGSPKRAGDCTDEETVLVEVWDPRAKRSVRHQALRDTRCWRAELARRDGTGASVQVTASQVQAAPAEPRKERSRGWARVRAAGSVLAIEFAPFVADKAARHHRDSAAVFAQAELGNAVVPCGTWLSVPPAQLARAVAVVCGYLAEHGFEVRRLDEACG